MLLKICELVKHHSEKLLICRELVIGHLLHVNCHGGMKNNHHPEWLLIQLLLTIHQKAKGRMPFSTTPFLKKVLDCDLYFTRKL